jgi:hypothetical protein
MLLCRGQYEGQRTADGKRMHGRGVYTFPNGDRYMGAFHDGAFHGTGVLFFADKNGGGQYRGVWDSGKCISGEYIFGDGLAFEASGVAADWTFCTPQDRRMWYEQLRFIAPPSGTAESLPPHVAGASASTSGGSDAAWTTPNYGTTDGIAPAFREPMPASAAEFCRGAPPPPEHAGKADPAAVPPPAMQKKIADAEDGGMKA